MFKKIINKIFGDDMSSDIPFIESINDVLLHIISTDKSVYYIYNTKNPIKDGLGNLMIIVDNKSILEKEIFDESWGLMGGDSYSRYVTSCINVLRREIKIKGEVIIEDKKI